MVTLVGLGNDVTSLLKNLIELDFDAIEAYEAAIARLKDINFKNRLEEFKNDHMRHVRELSLYLKAREHKVPEGPDMKKVLTKGKVVIASLMGDKAILQAMKTNENDTNTAYERACEYSVEDHELSEMLKRFLEDEKKHREWIEGAIAEIL